MCDRSGEDTECSYQAGYADAAQYTSITNKKSSKLWEKVKQAEAEVVPSSSSVKVEVEVHRCTVDAT